ncbi:MAG TPA: helix-turn-helix domain-containing protein [Gemmatimonadaceae bacterium]
MLRIVAMVGDAESSAHLRAAIGRSAHLLFVRDPDDFIKKTRAEPPDIIVLGTDEAAQPIVRLTVRQAVDRFPMTAVFAICYLVPSDIRVLNQAHYVDAMDVLFVRVESTEATRDRLLRAERQQCADMLVRRTVCQIAPNWLRPLIEWCLTHDCSYRPGVRSLSKAMGMRRETLARLCRARGVCTPLQLISWMTLLRAAARLTMPRASLPAIAHELGFPSAASLTRLFVRCARTTPTQVREKGFDAFAVRALGAMLTPGHARRQSPRLARRKTERGNRISAR